MNEWDGTLAKRLRIELKLSAVSEDDETIGINFKAHLTSTNNVESVVINSALTTGLITVQEPPDWLSSLFVLTVIHDMWTIVTEQRVIEFSIRVDLD